MPLPETAQSLLETFGRVVIINLPERADRRRGTEAALRRIGLSLDHPDVHLYSAIRPPAAGGFPSIGAHGAFLSHLGVMEHLLAEGWPRALVLEDDVALAPGFASRWPGVAAALAGQEWYLFYGHAFYGHAGEGAETGTSGLVRLPSDRDLIQLHLMGLTRRAAEVAVPALRAMLARPPGSPEGGPMHVDGALNWVRRQNPGLIALAAAPALAHQRASRSDIAGPRWFDRLPGLSQLANLARRLR